MDRSLRGERVRSKYLLLYLAEYMVWLHAYRAPHTQVSFVKIILQTILYEFLIDISTHKSKSRRKRWPAHIYIQFYPILAPLLVCIPLFLCTLLVRAA